MGELVLPFTETARKYGYVLWSKEHDAAVRELLGARNEVDLVLPGDVEQHKAVDWKHRRISVGYSVTRPLPEATCTIELVALAPGRIRVAFA